MYGIIYIATSLETGKQYVGQTIQGLRRRIKHHLCSKNKQQTYFDNALQKRGLAGFSFVQLPYPKDELNYQEQFWIAKLGTLFPGGYNLTTGGLVFEHSQATRHKLSVALRGRKVSLETRAKIGKANGGPKSIEHRKKLSIAKMGNKNANFGKPRTLETIEKIRESVRKSWANPLGRRKGG